MNEIITERPERQNVRKVYKRSIIEFHGGKKKIGYNNLNLPSMINDMKKIEGRFTQRAMNSIAPRFLRSLNHRHSGLIFLKLR